MRISIDAAACTGHGRCYVLAPEVFDSDGDGHSVARFDEVPETLERQALTGVANCPERAITCQ